MVKLNKKICRLCEKLKPLSRFSYRKDSKKLRTECKDCLNKRRKEQKGYMSWHKKNKHIIKHHSKKAGLKRHYGLTVEDYDLMVKSQNNRCLICKTKEPNNHGTLCVDHCHKSGAVRGLLCDKCNRGLGFFDDNLIVLKKAVKYLEKDYSKNKKINPTKSSKYYKKEIYAAVKDGH